jgi:hypothetical protein
MPDKMKCPRCKEGVMRLPLGRQLDPGKPEGGRPGTKLVCSKCGYCAEPTEFYSPTKKSN